MRSYIYIHASLGFIWRPSKHSGTEARETEGGERLNQTKRKESKQKSRKVDGKK